MTMIYEPQKYSQTGKLYQSKSLLPSISVMQKPQQKKKYVNYNVMLNLPVIVKEKSILDRKNTIAIFKKKKIELFNNQGKKKEKKKLLNNGRIYINEFWSDKFDRNYITKESKIQNQLDQIQALTRKNVNVLINEMHDSIEDQGSKMDVVQAYQDMVASFQQHKTTKLTHGNKTQSSIPILNQTKIDDRDLNNQFLTKVYQRKNYRVRTNQTQQYPKYDSINQFEEIGKDISLIPQSFHSLADLTGIKMNSVIQYKQDFTRLIRSCLQAQFPDEDVDIIQNKPWLSNSVKSFDPIKPYQSKKTKSELKKESVLG